MLPSIPWHKRKLKFFFMVVWVDSTENEPFPTCRHLNKDIVNTPKVKSTSIDAHVVVLMLPLGLHKIPILEFLDLNIAILPNFGGCICQVTTLNSRWHDTCPDLDFGVRAGNYLSVWFDSDTVLKLWLSCLVSADFGQMAARPRW